MASSFLAGCSGCVLHISCRVNLQFLRALQDEGCWVSHWNIECLLYLPGTFEGRVRKAGNQSS